MFTYFCGVCLSIVISPLLFIIYTNDIAQKFMLAATLTSLQMTQKCLANCSHLNNIP